MTPTVLIAGAGPVGLTAACELARFGLAARIVDKNERRTDKSKAIVIWPRTLELLDRMAPGFASQFVAAGLKAPGTTIRSGKNEIAHVDLTQIDSPFNFALLIPQSETERLLEEHLVSLGVRVERQTELKGFEPREDDVACILVHSNGNSEELPVSWLLGCDGAHSMVRHTLGMEFHGETLLNDWILADVHLKGAPDVPEIQIYWNSDGVLALFPLGARRYRVIADVGESQGSTGEGQRPLPTMADVQRLLDTRGAGGVVAFDAVWISPFSINERKVTEYRSGRIFLAGDAAHVHSPAGGQGMNMGMQDVFNLSWKLALVSRGLCAPEPLLSSYSEERSAVAKLVLEATGKATAIAVLQGGVRQTIRNHVASWLLGMAPIRHAMADALTELSVGYSSSPLNETSTQAPGGPEAGKRAPIHAYDKPVGTGDTPRFVLHTEREGVPAELLRKYSAILEPEVRQPFHGGGIWLVRPDGYVALTTKSTDWSTVLDYLRRLSAA